MSDRKARNGTNIQPHKRFLLDLRTSLPRRRQRNLIMFRNFVKLAEAACTVVSLLENQYNEESRPARPFIPPT